ncbi:tetratricopeptide (TPR) repeat protein [Sphingomonas jinjuensis]|uniref:Tetratricopeptide (TPR) repeat protein n=1 Tax=Sphingomonas jinjuensis TaxID=535907 RepID=A0A840FAW8_9SPHN|nr:tetratricopeptide repeat protein [Sphingomonas jinjuensis]MBB4152924.1 tetratricopeptide (TPR) repeat protein [Sphingomonas jinjuensis]
MSDDRGGNIQNLLGMARTAVLAGNNEEAIAYYNRVLEVDPGCSEAWLGKGTAAGWLSSIAQLRVNESLVAYGNAIGSASDDDKSTAAAAAANELGKICDAIYGMARQHYVDHAAVAGVRETYVRTSAVLSDALQQAHAWDPLNRHVLDVTVLICRQLLDLGGIGELAPILRERLDEAVAEIQTMDPSYQRPALALRTEADKEQAKAESDQVGYIVLFIVLIFAAIAGAVAKSGS